jgi:hypothetical protein
MPIELDPKMADYLVTTAVSSPWALPNEKIVCTRRALRQAFLAIAQEAYGLGFMAGEETRLRESTAPNSAGRPSWMDIRLDDKVGMAAVGLQLRPIVLRSLLGAGSVPRRPPLATWTGTHTSLLCRPEDSPTDPRCRAASGAGDLNSHRASRAELRSHTWPGPPPDSNDGPHSLIEV